MGSSAFFPVPCAMKPIPHLARSAEKAPQSLGGALGGDRALFCWPGVVQQAPGIEGRTLPLKCFLESIRNRTFFFEPSFRVNLSREGGPSTQVPRTTLFTTAATALSFYSKCRYRCEFEVKFLISLQALNGFLPITCAFGQFDQTLRAAQQCAQTHWDTHSSLGFKWFAAWSPNSVRFLFRMDSQSHFVPLSPAFFGTGNCSRLPPLCSLMPSSCLPPR